VSGREIDRREFVRLSAAAGGAFLLAVALPRRALGMEDVGAGERPRDDAFAPNLWLRIDPSGDVTILSHKSEMGQGVWTALPMIVAEELDADWDRVRIERAPTIADFDSATGGSSSVSDSWDTLRKAGAVARAMLVAAAAQQWRVPADSCTTERGVVVHAASGRRAPYGSLASTAAKLPVPNASTVSLKDPHTFRIVGTEMSRRDLTAKVTGTAQFGIDVTLPNMLVACIARCPSFRGKASRVNDARARAVPGVRQVIQLDPVPKQHPGRVAVLADDTWAALQGCRALDIEWDTSVDASVSTDAMWSAAREAVSDDASALVVATQGASPNGADRGRTVEATYELPFVAHACMEPMNCTAWVTADRAQVWAPTQFPEAARETVAGLTGLPLDTVDVHVTFLGGGFGRRAYQDFVIEAAELSRRAGVPVKVVWTREDDIQHDLYRPAQLQHLSAILDDAGHPVMWTNRGVGMSQQRWWNPSTKTPQQRDGADAPPYDIANYRLDFIEIPGGVPMGAWRSVRHSHNGFCIESFIDECALAAHTDPVAYRVALLDGKPRQQAVVQLAAERAHWGAAMPNGKGRGIAYFNYGGTYVAQVAEVTVAGDGAVHVDRMICAFDCGTIVNPDTVRAQVESAIVWGLSAALYGEITVTAGRVQQHNFDDFRVLRLAETPPIEVYLVRNFETPTGVGEPAVPPVAPAVANAVFAASGRRIRRLPLAKA